VTAQGTVYCKKWGPDQVKVSLAGNSTYSGATVIPPNMVFGGTGGSEETRSFAVTTEVPQGTSCYDTPTITVMGVYVQGGIQYDVDPVTLNIEILQYHRIEVFFDDGGSRNKNHSTIKAGESVNLEFAVHNTGNGNDKFQVDFKGREDLENQGFSLPNPEIVSIPEKRSEVIKWNIGTSEEMSGRYRIDLSIVSKGSEEMGDNVKLISPMYIKIEDRTVVDTIGEILFSPLVILLLIVVALVVIVVRHKRKG
jgi:hypothetical protein